MEPQDAEMDEEAIRAKLLRAGWDKKRVAKDKAAADDKPKGKEDRRDHERDRDRKSSRGSRSHRSRSRSRRRDRDRDQDRDREKDRDHEKDRDRDRDRRSSRSSRHKPSSRHRSRSRSVSKSRSRSAARSGSKRHSSSKRRASKSRSRSASRAKESGSKRSRRSSRSPSGSTSRKSRKRDASADKKEKKDEKAEKASSAPADDSSAKDVDKANDKSESGKNSDGKADDRENERAKKKDSEKEPTSESPTASHKKPRRSSRRSHSKSRSPSRSSRRRRHRSRSRSRSASRSRRSRRSSRSRSRSRSRRDRDRRRRGRSASRSRSRSSRRHRRSSSRDRKRRDSQSSVSDRPAAAPAAAPVAEVPVNPTITQLMQQYPTLSLQEIIAKMQAVNVNMAAAAATKPTRELYVGNLPTNVTGPQLQEFLGTIIQQVGLTTQPGNPIVNTWLSSDGHFAFCEMRTAEECSLALLLNQLSLLGQPLKFGRPKSFTGPPQPLPPVSARTQTALVNLGCAPNPMWFTVSADTGDQSALLGVPAVPSGISSLAASVASVVTAPLSTPAPAAPQPSSNKLIMMNIPIVLNEDQVKELVEPFGKVQSFTLVKDTSTGVPTASAVFEYEDASVTDQAASGLDGLDIGGIPLSVRRESATSVLPPVEQPSPVVKMTNMVSEDELKDDEEFADLTEDVEEECKRFGTISLMEIPRPKDGEDVSGVGNIFVRFKDASEAAAAIKALSGRKFGGNIVQVSYYPLAKFEKREFA